MAKTIDKLDKSVQQTLDMSGYATASHGTHVTFTTTAPKVAGTAAAGSATTVSRSDHVHPPQTSVSGNAGSATKLATARTITLTGAVTGSVSFDGSANVSMSTTTNHNHSFLESVDTRNTNPNPNTYTSRGITPEFKSASGIGLPNVGKNFAGVLTYQQWSDVSNWSGGKTTQLATIDDGRMYYRKGDGSGWGSWYQFYTTQNKPSLTDIGAAAATHGTHVTYSTSTPLVAGTAAVGSASNVSRGDHVHPAQTTVSGNAGSATKLQTARNIVIGNKTNSFNGTANITFTLSDIGAAASGHTHNYAGSSSAGGVANSATKLATARTINGTSFDGSANITTANWGTSRTLTIGNKGKSVNGSGNISWSAAEMGLVRGNNASVTTDATAGWYRIATSAVNQNTCMATFIIHGNIGSYHTATIINAGISYGKNPTIIQLSHTNYGAGITKARIVYHETYNGNYAYLEIYNSQAKAITVNTEMIGNTGWTLLTTKTAGSVPSGYTNKEITFIIGKIVSNIQGNVNGSSGSCSGNSATATTLQTARTINGTSFNGSANITTANWGTSRTITIGSTGKAVNGSGNVSWTLSEIGAAAASHGNHVPATQTANARKFLRNDNSWQSLPTASTSATGIVQLNNTVTSTSTTQAATANAVKTAYDKANEAFQSGSNAKTKLVNALTAKGATASTSDSWDTLISKVDVVSKKFATGRMTWDYNGRVLTDRVFTIDNIGFTPTSMFVVLDNVYCTRTVAADVIISNHTQTTINEDEEYYVTLQITNMTSTGFTIDFVKNYANAHSLWNGLTWYAFG